MRPGDTHHRGGRWSTRALRAAPLLPHCADPHRRDGGATRSLVCPVSVRRVNRRARRRSCCSLVAAGLGRQSSGLRSALARAESEGEGDTSAVALLPARRLAHSLSAASEVRWTRRVAQISPPRCYSPPCHNRAKQRTLPAQIARHSCQRCNSRVRRTANHRRQTCPNLQQRRRRLQSSPILPGFPRTSM